MCLHFWVGNLEERDQSGKKKTRYRRECNFKIKLKGTMREIITVFILLIDGVSGPYFLNMIKYLRVP